MKNLSLPLCLSLSPDNCVFICKERAANVLFCLMLHHTVQQYIKLLEAGLKYLFFGEEEMDNCWKIGFDGFLKKE